MPPKRQTRVPIPPPPPLRSNISLEREMAHLSEFDFPIDEDDNGDLTRFPGAVPDRGLMQEQDEAYEACVLADVQREIDAMEKRQLRQLQEDSWYEEQQRKSCRVPPEPLENEPGVRIQFRFHIEGGTDRRLVRRFPLDTTLAELYYFAESQPFLPVGTDIQVMTTFPREVLTPSEQALQGVLGCATRDWALNVEGSLERDQV